MTGLLKVAALTLAFVSLPAVTAAQEITWKMGHLTPPGSSYLSAVQSVPERVDKATNGEVNVELFATLFQVREQPQAVRDGRLDMIAGVHPFLSGTAPTLAASELPGLFWDIDDYITVIESDVGDHLRDVWSRQFNSHVLAFGAFDRSVILSNKKLAKVEDFRGLKIRVPSAGAAQLMGALGARPVQLAFSEIAPALSSGVVDAVLTDAGTSRGMGFDDIAEYLHVWHSGVFSWAMVINNDVWNGLDPELQETITAEFQALQKDHFDGYKARNDEIIKSMGDSGMEIIIPPKDEVARMYSDRNTELIFNSFTSLAKKTGSDGEAVIEMVKKALNK
ncbi:TRAP transporter substrate-binding protein DctP [Granulosicoccus sp.]|nr:TRAP transporter substrate-binding protein DctP [Granulosicoccus sp.]